MTVGARRLVIAGLVAAGLSSATHADAWERDVHYGLTRWLALQAGFDASQAEAIGIGDDRVDGGLLDSQALAPEYACLSRDAQVAREVQSRHYPSEAPAPAFPQQRRVIPGSESARHALMELERTAKGKEGLMLGKLGEALHPLQDSWAHQGVPSAPERLAGTVCDAALFFGHPDVLGGWTSHAADLTHLHPEETLTMARATYEALRNYPAIQGQVRRAVEWPKLEAAVREFARGSTKAEKLAWFSAHGIEDRGILNGLSLPDGAFNGVVPWQGYKLPALPQAASLQHEVPQEVRLYFDRLLGRWLGPSTVESVLDDEGGVPKRANKRQERARRELLARLKLWKLADHGSAAGLAHTAAPLSEAQLQQVDRLARRPRAFVSFRSVIDAVFPIEAVGPKASPLLPYLVMLSAAEPGRATALVRLKHAPYDTLVLVAERRGDRWALAEMLGVVDP